MKATANIATYAGREKSLELMLKSIEGQFDEVRIYDNSKRTNTADNGKFYWIDYYQEDERYFMLDDDLIYPPDYRETLEKHLEKHPVVSCHGRKLNPYGNFENSYYSGGHFTYSYRTDLDEITNVEVIGTGVSAIDTRYFSAPALFADPRLMMSDLLFSLEAAKQNLEMVIIPHKQDWIKPIHNNDSISVTQSKTDQRDQIEIVKEIMKLRNIL